MTTDLLQQASVLFRPTDIIEVRLIWADETNRPRSRWCLASELPTLIDPLHAENADGANIYIGVAPRCEHGRRGDDAVLLVRVLFADFDHTTVDEALAKCEAVGLPAPSLAINSGHGSHLYWRLLDPLTPDQWRTWQQDLAALVGSDPSVFNPERLARAAGFLNVKRAPFVPCEITCNTRVTFDLADLPIPMRAGSDTPVPLFTVRRIIDPSEAGDPFERCRAYLAKCPNAVAGAKGHRTTWHAANTANRFGLTQPEAIDLLRWYSTTKCDPPWSEKEIEHKVADAYRRNAAQHGNKLREASNGARASHFTVRRVA